MVQGNDQIPSHSHPSPVPPSEPPLQVMRGPKGGAEVGGQWDKPTQQQVLRGVPVGSGPPLYVYSDDRGKNDHLSHTMEVATVVDLLNQLCKQKPAGGFELPQLPESQYCLICNKGSICLGSSCKGKEGSKHTVNNVSSMSTFSSDIPGLNLSSHTVVPSTVLTNRDRTRSLRYSISALSPQSSLFNPKINTPSLTRTPSRILKLKASSKPKSKLSISGKTPGFHGVKLTGKLKKILLKTSLKPAKEVKKPAKEVKKTVSKPVSCLRLNSLLRKLATSELRCERKALKRPRCKAQPSSLFSAVFTSAKDTFTSSTCKSSISVDYEDSNEKVEDTRSIDELVEFINGKETEKRTSQTWTCKKVNSTCSYISDSFTFPSSQSTVNADFSNKFLNNYKDILSYLTSELEDSRNSPSIEILRSSSPGPRSRCPSPIQEGQRTPDQPCRTSPESPPLSPRTRQPPLCSHITPAGSPPPQSQQRSRRQSTPRKVTPTKDKSKRLQCRNQVCRVWFTTERARELHEAMYCDVVPANEATKNVNNVPSHDTLDLDPLQCRVADCLKVFSTAYNRKKHEVDKHKLYEKRGRTVSPLCFSVSPDCNAISRPQSCPPPQFQSIFLTPERPSKKKRRVSASSPYSSPAHSPASPLPSPSALTSPTLSLTPHSSDLSSSETDSDTSGTSEVAHHVCPSCHVSFKKKKYLKYGHVCNFRYDPVIVRQSNISPTVLTPAKNLTETLSILSHLCQEDLLQLCILQGWCMPSVYPLVFPDQLRAGNLGSIPLLLTHTANTHSTGLLKKIVSMRKEVKLPKHIVIKNTDDNLEAYLSSNILTPPSDYFVVTETLDHFYVSQRKEKEKTKLIEKDSLDGDIDSDDSDSDSGASDDMFGYHDPDFLANYDSIGGVDIVGANPENIDTAAIDSVRNIVGVHRNEDHEDEISIGGADVGSGVGGGGGDGGGGDDGGGNADNDGTNDYCENNDDITDRGGNGGGNGVGNGGGDGGGDGDGDGGGDDDDDGGGGDSEDDDDHQDDVRSNQDQGQLLDQFFDILPPDFLPGIDGLGARHIQQRQAISLFRKPWEFPDSSIQVLVRQTKLQFFNLVETCRGARTRRNISKLNIFAECFLLLLKLCHQLSFDILVVLFALPNKSTASMIFYRQLIHQYRTNSNIPAVIQNGNRVGQELDKLLDESYQRTPTYFKTLLDKFEDPSGRNRIAVGINIDSTYFDCQGGEDIELQKHVFYQPRSNHTIKLLNLTDLSGKIIGLLPVASSQTPSSGDSLLLSKHIELQEETETGKYVRTILGGNERYFVLIISDAGFVISVPNAPSQSRSSRSETLANVCHQEHAVLLHTSSKYEKYHLEITPQGKLRKIAWTPDRETQDQNVVKFTRLFRKIQEQVHAALKAMFKIFDMRHLPNSYLLPLPLRQLDRLNLRDEQFKNMPKLNYIVTVCSSILNAVHPGFLPLYMDQAQQQSVAVSFLSRLLLENPLLYPDTWPVSFTTSRRGTDWVEVTFGDLDNVDVIGFPKLDRDSINPTALEIVSGPHALQKADSVLTYMNQLLIKDLNLSREETIQRLRTFPNNWHVQYLDIQAPQDFHPSPDIPRWVPTWWNESRFGPWHNLRIVRSRIPPSYKSATSPANYHWAVIAFGTEPSIRMGLRHPYDTIYFWYCFRCPALNGSLSMCRHLAALLKGLSFKSEYKSTAKAPNLLNTVAGSRRQTTDILPSSLSVNLPSSIERRSRNTRTTLAGRINPLYDLNSSSSSPSPSTNFLASNIPSVPSNPSNPSRPVISSSGSISGSTSLPTSLSTPPISSSIPPPSSSPPTSSNYTDEHTRNLHDPPNPSPNGFIDTPAEESGFEAPPPARQPRRPRGRRLDPDTLLNNYLASIDQHGIYNIPESSQSQVTPHSFGIQDIQPRGLINDGNVCGTISIILCLHRIRLLPHLMDPHFTFTANQTPDYPSMILRKILSAMPSPNPFSIHLFIHSWNISGKTPRIDPDCTDIPPIIEALLTSIPLKRYSSRPVISSFMASFTCQACGANYVRERNWIGQLTAAVPLLQLPPGDQAADISVLLASYLDTPFNTRCNDQACRQPIFNVRYETEPGYFTVLAINRFDINDIRGKRMNKLVVTNNPSLSGHQLLGDLVSCVCHRGSVNAGHFVSYHKISSQWYLNDDSRRYQVSPNPLEQACHESQTVDLLFFVNNV